MSKLKNYFRVRLRRFLGIDDVESKIDKLGRGMDYYQKSNISYHDCLRDRINSHSDKINAIHTTLESVVSIGADVVPYDHRGSWAVVCIEGKVNRIKFVNLNRANVEDIMRFLKHYEAGRHTIDSPFGLNSYIQDNLVFSMDYKDKGW